MTVEGDREAIDDFFATHLTEDSGGDSHFDLNTFIPMPEALEGTKSPVDNPDSARNVALRKEYGYDNWYDWKINNWGTKWNTYENYIDHDTNTITFQTAWDLPRLVLVKMASMYPNLKFHLEVVEEGGYFAGTVDIVNGQIVDGLTSDYNTWKKYATEFMGWEFEDEDE